MSPQSTAYAILESDRVSRRAVRIQPYDRPEPLMVRMQLLSVCLFEQAQGLFHIVGMLPQAFRVPLASLGSKEIASVNVNGTGQT